MKAPGVREETLMRYKANGSAEMTDTSMVRACGVNGRRSASPLLSMVRESSVTVVSGASRIPFERSSRIRRFPWRSRSSMMVEEAMAMRKREDEVFPNAAGIDVGGSSHWVAVPRHLAEQTGCEAVREFGAMTDDLNALATWLLGCGVDTVALESTGVYWIPVYEVLEQHGLKVWLVDARQMKYVPGRKSDVQDCQWLQKLMSLGLLRAAWRPSAEVCVREGSKTRAEHDIRQRLADWAGVDLTRINGLGVTVVMKLLTEIGPDLSRFCSVKHFCSWLGLCPGTKISGGKVLSSGTKRSANRVRQALKMAAMTLCRSESALGAFYRRLCARMDKPRANTATAHKLARMVYFMLTRGEAFVDQGQQQYEEQQRQRSIAALKRRAAALGFQINPGKFLS
jgi:transposase